MRLRVHHLFCSALYAGKGYSEGFCRNMQKIVQWLWEEAAREEGRERKVELVAGPDCICRQCPNLTGKGCGLDHDHVVSKDVRLAQSLKLIPGRVYTVAELLHQAAGNMTEEIFRASCEKCQWYQMGLCRYEDLKKRYCQVNNYIL